MGIACPSAKARSFHKKAAEHIPEALWAALGPILETIGSLSERIRDYERQLEMICQEHYPETDLLRQVEGVGVLTALTWGSCPPPPGRERGTLRNASPKKVMRC